MKKQRTVLQAEIEEREGKIKTAYELINPQGQWITAGSQRFRVTQQRGRRILKRDRLLQELTPMLGEHEAEKLLSWCEEEGEAFERLYVNKISVKK